jgi:uncharacterized membrane protein
MKEFILLVFLPISIILMYYSLSRIYAFEKSNNISKANKYFLIYVSILIPVLGYILTNKLKTAKN